MYQTGNRCKQEDSWPAWGGAAGAFVYVFRATFGSFRLPSRTGEHLPTSLHVLCPRSTLAEPSHPPASGKASIDRPSLPSPKRCRARKLSTKNTHAAAESAGKASARLRANFDWVGKKADGCCCCYDGPLRTTTLPCASARPSLFTRVCCGVYIMRSSSRMIRPTVPSVVSHAVYSTSTSSSGRAGSDRGQHN